MTYLKYGGLLCCAVLAAASIASQPPAARTSGHAAAPLTSRTQEAMQAAPGRVRPAARQTLYVGGWTGNDDWDGLCPTWDGGTCGPKRTVQAGIEAAVDGDAVLLADGVYTGDGNKDLDFAGKAISVQSAGDDPATCVIDCGGQGRGFAFRNGETAEATVQGLTIRNGSTDAGAGVYCDNNSNPSLINCTIVGGTAYYGGAVACWDSSPTLADCTFADNTGYYQGGALCFTNSSATLTNCTLRGNITHVTGGGVFCDTGSLTLTDCRIFDSTAARGGGIYCTNGGPSLTNCTILGNAASHEGGGVFCDWADAILAGCSITGNVASNAGGGVWCNGSSPMLTNCTITGNQAAQYGGVACTESSPTLANCILWADTAPEIYVASGSPVATYCDIQGGWPGDGNVDADPGFAFAADAHLLPGSPCIDAGINDPPGALPAQDIEGLARILDGDGDGQALADMGAHEFNPAAPTIAVSTTELVISAEPGHTVSQTLNIRNSSLGTLNWALDWDVDWLSAEPAAGQSDGEINVVNLTVDAHLAYGEHRTVLWVTDAQACNSPRAVSFVLNLHPLRVPADYPTIQAAIDAAFDGDEVVVADGTYSGPGNKDLDFLGKAITVRSESGDTDNCVINCGLDGRGAWFHNGESSAATLAGFSILGGRCAPETLEVRGAGILCTNGSSPTISNCVIQSCESHSDQVTTPEGTYEVPGGGAGLACLEHSHPTLLDCLIEQCTAMSGGAGGVLCDGGSSPSFCDCTIRDCVSVQLPQGFGGAALACLNGSDASLTGCLIDQNYADYGCAGIYCESSNPTLTDCTFNANGDEDESDTGGLACRSANPTLRRCSFTGNSGAFAGGIYCDHSSPVVHDCTFSENGGAYASAILCEWYSYPEITGCRMIAGTGAGMSFPLDPSAIVCRCAASVTLASCLIDDAGGLRALAYGHPVVRNCTFTGSVISSYSSDIALQSSIAWPAELWAYSLADFPAQLILAYCDVQGGEPAVQVDPGSTVVWGDGNIDADPTFVSPDGPDGNPATWEDNDYHLSAGSPCIDAGVPGFTAPPGETDMDGQFRVWQVGVGTAGRVDMGADEFGVPDFGDLNCDGAVNAFDIDPFVLALTAAEDYADQYPACARMLADLNGDGTVNAFDIDPFVSRLTGGQGDAGSD